MRHLPERMQQFGKKRMMADLIVLCLTLLIFSFALAADTWDCPECGRTGNTGNFCGDCGHASPYVEGQTNDSSQETDTTAEFKTVGNIVIFGRYEQDNKTENGPEEIEWVVLDYDEKANKALLLSRYGLDAKSFNEKRTDITWNECTLRAWLNESFLNTAFTEMERDAILLTNVDNSNKGSKVSGGNDTQDKIFLLSYAEANKYLGVTGDNRDNMKSRVAPTAYTINQGAWTPGSCKTADNKDAGWWWLRSPGLSQYYAGFVSPDGSFDFTFVDPESGCVRPALWINLESEFF